MHCKLWKQWMNILKCILLCDRSVKWAWITFNSKLLLKMKIIPRDPLCEYSNGIIEWFGLEGTLKIISFLLPWTGNTFLYPRLSRAPSDLALDISVLCLGLSQPPWVTSPAPHHSHSREFFPDIWSKPAFMLKLIPLELIVPLHLSCGFPSGIVCSIRKHQTRRLRTNSWFWIYGCINGMATLRWSSLRMKQGAFTLRSEGSQVFHYVLL